jgi:hypothetical protein
MPIEDFLLPINAGKQVWQMLWSNTTSGDHPYNFSGICQALVSQWFLELRFAAGRQPDELGRYLLKGDLGRAGYNGLAKAQGSGLSLQVQSGGTLSRATGLFSASIPLAGHAQCSAVVLTSVRGIDTRQMNSEAEVDLAIQQNANVAPTPFSAQLSIKGVHSRWISWAIGNDWGHAIGIHCNGHSLFVFDPNYGTFILNPISQLNVSGFFQDLWARYTPRAGSFDPIAVH